MSGSNLTFEVKVENTGNIKSSVSLSLRNISACGNYSINPLIASLEPEQQASHVITINALNVSEHKECLCIIEASTENISTAKTFLLKVKLPLPPVAPKPPFLTPLVIALIAAVSVGVVVTIVFLYLRTLTYPWTKNNGN